MSEELQFKLLPEWNDLPNKCREAMVDAGGCFCGDADFGYEVYQALRETFPPQPFPLFTVSKIKAEEMIEREQTLRLEIADLKNQLNQVRSETERKTIKRMKRRILKLVRSWSSGAFTGWKGYTGESLITLDFAEDHFSECMVDMQKAIKKEIK